MKKQESGRDHNAELRERSGRYTSADRLTSFLYTLMRDHLPVGDVEALVREVEDENISTESPNQYTNGWLAEYSADLAIRLRNGKLRSTITVNSLEISVDADKLYYRDIIRLAASVDPSIDAKLLYTVVYRSRDRRNDSYRSGSLVPGESVDKVNGLIFTVAYTGNA